MDLMGLVYGYTGRIVPILRGSGYLGYVDSNQGYNPYRWVICPLTRVINLHITSYLPYPEPLSSSSRNKSTGFVQ